VDILPFVVLVVDIHFSFGDTPCVDIQPYDIQIAEDIVLSSVDTHPSFVVALVVDILPSSEENLFAGILPSFEDSLFADIHPSFEDNPFEDIPQKIAFYLSILSLLPIWYTIVYVHLEIHA
jgi:hypothetical protein